MLSRPVEMLAIISNLNQVILCVKKNCLFNLKMNSFVERRFKWRDIDKAYNKNEWSQNLSKRNIILDNISVLDLVIRSKSHVSDRRGGVCVLWMLLVFFFLKVTWHFIILNVTIPCVIKFISRSNIDPALGEPKGSCS